MLKKQRIHAALAAAVLFTLAVIVVVSCQKEPDIRNANANNPVEQSQAIVEHIKSFKKKMEMHRDNPGLKSSELFTADSAVWEIESQLNFNYCYNNIDIIEKELATFDIIMPLNTENKISFDDLVDLYYNIIIDSIQEKMLDINYQNMKLLVVDLEQTGTTTEGDAIISVGSLIGNEQTVVLHNDNWWYGQNMGMCNGSHVPEDAATQLDARVTEAMLPEPPHGCRWFFTSIDSTYIFPQQDTLDYTPDNYLDYKIFFATTEGGLTIDDEVKCLSQYEMSTYKGYYIDYAQDFESETGKKFDYCYISGKPYSDPYRIQHDYWIYVGYRGIICDVAVDDILAEE